MADAAGGEGEGVADHLPRLTHGQQLGVRVRLQSLISKSEEKHWIAYLFAECVQGREDRAGSTWVPGTGTLPNLHLLCILLHGAGVGVQDKEDFAHCVAGNSGPDKVPFHYPTRWLQ